MVSFLYLLDVLGLPGLLVSILCVVVTLPYLWSPGKKLLRRERDLFSLAWSSEVRGESWQQEVRPAWQSGHSLIIFHLQKEVVKRTMDGDWSLSARHHSLQTPKEYHQLGTKYSDTSACGRHFSLKPWYPCKRRWELLVFCSYRIVRCHFSWRG